MIVIFPCNQCYIYLSIYIRVDANDAMHMYIYLNCARPPSSILITYYTRVCKTGRSVFLKEAGNKYFFIDFIGSLNIFL